MRLLFVAFVALMACGSPQPPAVSNHSDAPPDAAPSRAPVTCGATTCGPDEYCENRCTCCGMRPAEPTESSGTSTCVPLPASCHGISSPECDQRTVDIPCA